MKKFWSTCLRYLKGTAQFVRRNLLNIVVLLLSIVVILSLILLVLPANKTISDLNKNLSNVANILVFLSTVYTAAAFLVALIAYQAAVRRPRLRVRIWPWMGEKDNDLKLIVTPSNRVDITRPFTSWQLWIENTGGASAKFPVVQIEFHGLFFAENTFEKWDKVLHANALGWYGIRWSPGANTVVHPNFPLELPSLYFSGLHIGSGLEIIVTVAADNFKPLRVKHHVTIEHSKVDYDWDQIDQRRRNQ